MDHPSPEVPPAPVLELAGHVAVVTGAAGGIGRALCQMLAGNGAVVLAADLPPSLPDLDQWLATWPDQAAAARIRPRVLDVTDDGAIDSFITACADEFGRLDILINNAGLGGPTAPIWETEIGLWNRHIAVMLTGSFLMMRAAIPLMMAGGYGRVVNISSMAGKEGNADTSPYSSAKAGLIGLTKTVGKELATTNVLVNVITPGVVESPMNHVVPREFHERVLAKIPMGRPGKPSELAELVLFLASPRMSFSTGAVFDFSGGRATY